MLENLIRITRLGNSAKKVFLFFATLALTVVVLGGEFALRSDLVQPETTSGSIMTKAAGDDIPLDAERPEEQSQAVVEAGLTGSVYADKADAVIRRIEPLDTPNDSGGTSGAAASEDAELAAFESAKSLTEEKQSLDVSNLPAKEGEFVYSSEIPMSYELQEYTYQKCVERGLEYELVLAVIWRESRFTVDAVNQNKNGTQDSGIMQINDMNKEWLFDRYGIDDLMDPYQNIDAGTAMLGNLTDKYGSHGAMLAYQYGEVGMARKIKSGETTSNLIELAYRQRDYYRKIV